MEDRNHHQSAARGNGNYFDSRFRLVSSVGSPGWGVGSYGNNGNPSYLRRVSDTSLLVRNDVYVPSTSGAASVMIRGLSEVTNRMEDRRVVEPSIVMGLWSPTNAAQKLKHLPPSAYSDRFRSTLSTTSIRTPRQHGTLYSKVKESNEREDFIRRARFASSSFPSRQMQSSPNTMASPFQQRGRPLSHMSPSNEAVHRSSNRASVQLSNNARDQATQHIQSKVHIFDRKDIVQTSARGMTLASPNSDDSDRTGIDIRDDKSSRKRSQVTMSEESQGVEEITTRPGLGMLDILCSATLELGPIQANPSTGCSCPRSNCIKLYCDCFKAGHPCSDLCSCLNCKNTEEETRVDGERIQAIKNTLARNPRAFTGGKKEAVPKNPGDVVCNCLKSRCLKLYCHCFHKGRTCNDGCLCVDCLNTSAESNLGGKRNLAVQTCLEKRPDAFTKKPKEIGSGCACKNNRCLKKYCDCYRFDLACTEKCVCKECRNGKVVGV